MPKASVEEYYDVVKQELSALPKIKRAGKNWMIVCPFHPDTDPSLSVNIGNYDVPPGVFYCFGCGAHGNWNVLAEALGLKPFSLEEIKDLRRKHVVRNGVGRDFYTYRPPRWVEPLPKGHTFGKISYGTLKKLGAKVWLDPVLQEKRLFFLVSVLGDTLGHFTLPIKPKASKKKVRMSPGNWAKRALWPYDHIATNLPLLVLVEGQKDAMRLIQWGIPALAILGINNWSSFKKELVLAKSPRKVVLFFDGDLGGRRATNVVYKDLKALVPTYVLLLPVSKGKKLDPYDCPKSYLRLLLRIQAKSKEEVRHVA